MNKSYYSSADTFNINDLLGIIPESTVSWKFTVVWSDWWKQHCTKWVLWESEQFFMYTTCHKKCHLMYCEENDIHREEDLCFLPSEMHKSVASDVTEDFFIGLTTMYFVWVCVCVCIVRPDPASFSSFLPLHEFPIIIISVITKVNVSSFRKEFHDFSHLAPWVQLHSKVM
jgi:hypothetical protein